MIHLLLEIWLWWEVGFKVTAIEQVGLSVLETGDKGYSEGGVEWSDLQTLIQEKLLDGQGFQSFLFGVWILICEKVCLLFFEKLQEESLIKVRPA